MKYQLIHLDTLNNYFKLVRTDGNEYALRYKKGRNTISIKTPFYLNDDCASVAGMMPDGSLIKDLARIYFTQKKSLSKLFLFKHLLIKLFAPNNKIFIRKGNNAFDTYINSQTMARFFYHILEIPKSDEQMRIPSWIFKSSTSIKIVYLKQAYDMEGTILKKLSEIRFITKDILYAKDLQRLLNSLDIVSTLNKRIGGTYKTIQYRISIYGRTNFMKFSIIGFRIKHLEKRFELLLKKYNLKDLSSHINNHY